jgi:hypothetical protein
MTSSVIAVIIFLAMWSVYMMGWRWWNEVAPTVEAQRITRVAVSSIVDGSVDTSAGQDSIGSNLYRRRNGISWTTIKNTDPDMNMTTPVISNNGRRVDFKLESDTTSSNVRAFYLVTGVDGITSLVYKDNSNVVHTIRGTAGITDILIEKPDPTNYPNLFKVTAYAAVRGSAKTVQRSDYVYLKNI